MATIAKRLVNGVIVLPVLLAVLLGFGHHGNAISHTTTISSSHYVADVDSPPPGH